MADPERDDDLDAPTLIEAGRSHSAPVPKAAVSDEVTIDRHGDSTRYEVESLLGRGGMGEVYLTTDRRIGRQVALKLLTNERQADREAQIRFLREAHLQGRLEHPAIVPVYDLDRSEDDHFFFTMKCVRGVTLARVLRDLRKQKPEALEKYSLHRLLTAFITTCNALAYAHDSHIVHRDVKPSNIMLGHFGEVYVLDWGCATSIEEARISAEPTKLWRDEAEISDALGLDSGATEIAFDATMRTEDGRLIGTPGYCSPEQARGAPIDGHSDVYTLGAILFELLTLEPLHGQRLPLARLLSTIEGGPQRPSVRRPDLAIPETLDRLVERARDIDPSRRPSPREMAEVVEGFLSDEVQSLHVTRSASHYAEAASRATRRALELGDESAREVALQAAGRALALDPQNREGRDALLQLLVAPPKVAPPETQRSAHALQARMADSGFQALLIRATIWLCCIPLTIALGIRNWFAAGLVIALLASLGAAAVIARWLGASGLGARFGILVLSCSVVGTVSGLFGPFVLVPAFAATTASMFATHYGRQERRLGIALGLAAIMVPWSLELVGILEPSMVFENNTIVFQPRLVDFPPVLTMAFLTLGNALLVPVNVLIASRLRDDFDRTRNRLAVRNWQLEQLVPDEGSEALTDPPPSLRRG